MQWPPKPQADLPSELTECIGNWKTAEAEPETVSALLEKEIANGWVIRTGMSIEQARQHWHKGIAVGKLNVVHAEGKDPQLVLDSTVCGVNRKLRHSGCQWPQTCAKHFFARTRARPLRGQALLSKRRISRSKCTPVNMACFCFGLPMSCAITATSEHASPHTGGSAPEHSS